MYVTPQNRVEDRALLAAFMRAHSFATLVTAPDGAPHATHLPFALDAAGDDLTLFAHMARANPQWREFAVPVEALVIFHEPHAYVSPSHYERAESVPTWNYVAVHAYGTPVLIEDRDAKYALMEKLIALHDRDYLARFPTLSLRYIDGMLGGVAAFSIAVTRIEARYKLSQEKKPAERESIAASLEASGSGAAAETAALMREHAP